MSRKSGYNFLIKNVSCMVLSILRTLSYKLFFFFVRNLKDGHVPDQKPKIHLIAPEEFLPSHAKSYTKHEPQAEISEPGV